VGFGGAIPTKPMNFEETGWEATAASATCGRVPKGVGDPVAYAPAIGRDR